jgi:exonuclease III
MPSGSSGEPRQEYKYQWLAEFDEYLEKYEQKTVLFVEITIFAIKR